MLRLSLVGYGVTEQTEWYATDVVRCEHMATGCSVELVLKVLPMEEQWEKKERGTEPKRGDVGGEGSQGNGLVIAGDAQVQLTSLWNESFLIKSSVLFWYFQIS